MESEISLLSGFFDGDIKIACYALTALASRHDLLFYLLWPSLHQCLFTSPTILFSCLVVLVGVY